MGHGEARPGRPRLLAPACPPHPRCGPTGPAPRGRRTATGQGRGRPPVTSCLCHLLFIDCRGLRRGGRPGAPGAELQRGRAEGGRSERTGCQEPRHTGASATRTSGHPGDVGRTRGRVLMAGAHQQGPRCPWPALETQRRPGACILGERGAVVSSSWHGDGFHQLAGAGGLGHPEATAPRPRPRALRSTLSNPRSLREEEKEMKTGKAKGGDPPLSTVPPVDGLWGQARGQPRPRLSLGRGRRAGLLLPRHGDGSLAVASVHSRRDLGAGEGQHAVRGQGAGERRLVHVGRQTVAAVELAGDVAVVVLGRARGRAPSEAAPPGAADLPW